MDGSILNDRVKAFFAFLIILMLASGGCGACVMKCSQTYKVNVSVEKVDKEK